MRKFCIIMPAFVMIVSNVAYAEPDSLIFTNDNYMVGEVKTMNKGVLMAETSFSDKDFAIEWEGIKEIYCTTFFLITLSDGRRFNGTISTSGPGTLKILEEDGSETEVAHNEIVFMDDVDRGFWSQLYASIDIGLDLTKANNFRQVSMRSTLGYRAQRWTLDGTFNTLNSSQDETEDIKRTDGGVGFVYFLPKDWYLVTSVDFLSNTEQKLDLRTTTKAGLGKFVLHTNRKYWGFNGGLNYNNEDFSSADSDRNSLEGFLGTELNLFDIGDLSLFTKLVAFPSFTESGRWRADFNIDTKYEMPFDDDFYIKIGLTFNYDNRPVAGASDTDYVFHSGFGWEW
ncbi:MAG: DUF481 domain-containing protein [Cytophagales bacterium]|nr:DUF481 domain-containing protein [Cytophagales bacterium]